MRSTDHSPEPPPEAPAAAMSFDPTLLLNPKAAHRNSPKKERTPKQSRSPARRSLLLNGRGRIPGSSTKSPSPAPPVVEDEDARQSGMASMIENMHNVADRQELPRKRLRLDDAGPKGANGSFAGSSGGVISDHLKAARAQDDHAAQFAMLDNEGVAGDTLDDLKPRDPSGLAGDLQLAATAGANSVLVKHEPDGQPSDVIDLVDNGDESIHNGNMHDEKPPKGTANDPVDLDDDDEAKSDDEKDTNTSETCCFGVLVGRCNIHRIPHPKTISHHQQMWPRIDCNPQRVRESRHSTLIVVKDALGKDFGHLDVRVSVGLAHLMDSSLVKIRVKVHVHPRKRKEWELPGHPCSESIWVSVVLSGPKAHAEPVGRFLGQRNLFLQSPGSLAKSPYYNPQEQNKNFAPKKSNYTSRTVTRTVEEEQEDLSNLFDSLPSADDIPETEPSDIVTTEMLPHQKQALTFMKSHEEPNVEQPALWKSVVKSNGRQVWQNIITDQETNIMPPPIRGGILADMMGLGKTLSILALIASTTDRAKSWAAGTALRLKATVLVAPLSVAANWEEQIAMHLKDGALKFVVYHGSNRRANPTLFKESDIIITTYNIVSSELFHRNHHERENSPFARFEFFRVVLDEAHAVRNAATAQSRAACELKTSRRWALTGTPIQNQLGDFGSLLRFLHVAPFEDGQNFARYVIAPFKQGEPGVLTKLRLLVSSLTLRRSKDKIDLPPREDRVVKLTLTKEERTIYSACSRDASNRIDVLSKHKQKLVGKSFAHVLRSILICRLLATAGKDLLSDDDLDALQGTSSSTAIDVEEEDEKPAITERTAYEMLRLCQETGTDMCASCGTALRSRDLADDTVFGFILPCYQLVCGDCEDQVRATMDDRPRFKCPFCGFWLRSALLKLTQEGLEQAEEHKAQLQANPRHAKMLGRYSGPHSKTNVLLTHLLESRAYNEEHPEEDPIKSVVFSTWTTHLDLIQLALAEHRFKWVRLDGKMNRAKRAESLRDFREERDVEVILVSIGAGGVGLNLTAASRVYMLQPQFNPAAEAQAIDRVHRMGQTKPVICTRLITDDSIEEGIVDLQERKKDLAEMSLGKEKVAETSLQKLERLKMLFK